jgi:hypothetical protein
MGAIGEGEHCYSIAMSISIGRFVLEEHSKRLREMTNEEVLKHGKAAREMAVYLIQLNETRREAQVS